MFYNLPVFARKELVYGSYSSNPMTLNVVEIEVAGDTKLGKEVLKKLGYSDG